jgi:hypothetical protein
LAQSLDHSATSADALLMRLLNKTAPTGKNATFPDDVAALVLRRIG